MDLKKKGMASVMDAMLFITVLGIAASVIFVHIPAEPQEVSAKDVHDDLFRIELKVSDVFDIDDDRVMPLQDLLVAQLISGKGNVSDHILSVLENKTAGQFIFVSSCEGGTLNIMSDDTSDAGTPRSAYNAVTDTPYGPLSTSLRLF
jgi:hypothetical protein